MKELSKEGIKVKGMFRVQIRNEDGTLHGDSGWKENVVTNLGIQNFLAFNLMASAGSVAIAYCALGTGAAPATNDTTLPGEVMSSTKRVTVSKTYSSRTVSNGSGTAYFYATFAAGFLSGAGSNLSNVGLYAATTTNDTLFAGNTYTSSACASNQAVNVTYQIQLG